MITRDQLAHIPDVNLEQPATEADIAHAEELIGCTFPKDYKDLLACSDGLFVGGAYSLNLYSTNYLQERNQTYEVAEYAPPGWVLIGDDGGGNGIFLDCSSSQGTLYRAGLGSMSRADAQLIAPRLASWVAAKLKPPEEPENDYPEHVDVWLLRPPAGGPRGLVRLKSELNLQMPIAELHRCLQSPPCRVLRAAPFVKYARKCAAHNATDPCLSLFEVDRPDQPVQIPDLDNTVVPPKARRGAASSGPHG